jgi:hypothetical protein
MATYNHRCSKLPEFSDFSQYCRAFSATGTLDRSCTVYTDCFDNDGRILHVFKQWLARALMATYNHQCSKLPEFSDFSQYCGALSATSTLDRSCTVHTDCFDNNGRILHVLEQWLARALMATYNHQCSKLPEFSDFFQYCGAFSATGTLNRSCTVHTDCFDIDGRIMHVF